MAGQVCPDIGRAPTIGRAPSIGRPKRHVAMLFPFGICHIIMTYNGV